MRKNPEFLSPKWWHVQRYGLLTARNRAGLWLVRKTRWIAAGIAALCVGIAWIAPRPDSRTADCAIPQDMDQLQAREETLHRKLEDGAAKAVCHGPAGNIVTTFNTWAGAVEAVQAARSCAGEAPDPQAAQRRSDMVALAIGVCEREMLHTVNGLNGILTTGGLIFPSLQDASEAAKNLEIIQAQTLRGIGQLAPDRRFSVPDMRLDLARLEARALMERATTLLKQLGQPKSCELWNRNLTEKERRGNLPARQALETKIATAIQTLNILANLHGGPDTLLPAEADRRRYAALQAWCDVQDKIPAQNPGWDLYLKGLEKLAEVRP
ncbi:MAG: hypothetical protein M3O22_07415 [Pseudomonadota bacterium]|nr:hypothetical protein [Pseudomonadota bacterium]